MFLNIAWSHIVGLQTHQQYSWFEKCVLNLNCAKCWKKQRQKNLLKGLTPAKKKKKNSEFVFENVLIPED